MLSRKLATLAFAAHALFGNFCMMSMTHAADMPMPPEPHAVIASMSPADCDHCLHEQHGSDSAPKKSPCENGHCISQAVPTNAVSNLGVNVISVAALPAFALKNIAVRERNTRPTAHAPPNPPIITKTIVLLM